MMLRNSPEGKLLIVVGILTVLTIALSVYAHLFPYLPGDLSLTLLFQSLSSDMLLSVMKWASFAFGGWRAYALVIVVSLVVGWRLGKLRAALVILSGISVLINAGLKIVIDRPRPTANLIRVLEVKEDASFPSGHAFFIMAVLGLTVYFAFAYVRDTWLRTANIAVFIILIIMTGASRVYLGAHWPSDVLGGYLAGSAILGILIWLDRRFSHRHPHPPN